MDSSCRRAARALIAAAMMCGAAEGYAQDGEPAPAEAPLTMFEITPFVGFRMGGDFDVANSDASANVDDHGAFSLALAYRRDEASQYELIYARQESRLEKNSPLAPLDVNVEYLHLGGTLGVNEEMLLRPYITGTLGLTRFTLQSGTDDTRFSVSLGAGFRVPVTQHFGLRFEARGFLTLIDTDSALFCASGSFGGVCSIRSRGSTFTQFEVMAGAAFAF
jgi:outer membrane protein with beta-barrel domain